MTFVYPILVSLRKWAWESLQAVTHILIPFSHWSVSQCPSTLAPSGERGGERQEHRRVGRA